MMVNINPLHMRFGTFFMLLIAIGAAGDETLSLDRVSKNNNESLQSVQSQYEATFKAAEAKAKAYVTWKEESCELCPLSSK